jgi:hypothetical protein
MPRDASLVDRGGAGGTFALTGFAASARQTDEVTLVTEDSCRDASGT